MKLSDEEKFIINTLAYYVLIDELEKSGTFPKETYYDMYENLNKKEKSIVSTYEVYKHEHITGLQKTFDEHKKK